MLPRLKCQTLASCLLLAASRVTTALETEPWPGNDDVSVVDTSEYFSENLSGLSYQPEDGLQPPILWAVQNYPPLLYKLYWDGADWVSTGTDGWSDGKKLRYTDGQGEPDAEDLTKAAWDSDMIFICSERNAHESISRLSVLLYIDADNADTMNATIEWDLTSDFPPVDANEGFEAITWVPDDFLVANNFMDDNLETTYDPANYPHNSGGLIFLGLESDGGIYAYYLNTMDGSSQQIASFGSGMESIMSLSFDRDTGYLWAMCDDNCDGVHSVHSVDNTTGVFRHIGAYERPASMGGNFDTEGFTTTPDAECDASGQKQVLWADDKNDGGHSLRRDTIPCYQFIDTSSLVLDDDVTHNSVWADEEVGLVMMGVLLGGMIIVGAAWVVYAYIFPQAKKEPTRLPPQRKPLESGSSGGGAKLSKDRSASSGGGGGESTQQISSSMNPLGGLKEESEDDRL